MMWKLTLITLINTCSLLTIPPVISSLLPTRYSLEIPHAHSTFNVLRKRPILWRPYAKMATLGNTITKDNRNLLHHQCLFPTSLTIFLQPEWAFTMCRACSQKPSRGFSILLKYKLSLHFSQHWEVNMYLDLRTLHLIFHYQKWCTIYLVTLKLPR